MNENKARLTLHILRSADPPLFGWVEDERIIWQIPDDDNERKKIILEMAKGLNQGTFYEEVLRLQNIFNYLDKYRTRDGTIHDLVKQANYQIVKEMLQKRYGIYATLFSKHLRSKSK